MSSPTDQLIVYFSDWRRLEKAAAWFLRLKAMLLEQSRLRKQLKTSVTNHQEETSHAKRQRVTATSNGHILMIDDLSGA